MEGKKIVRPRAILVFGAPCSGKTTFGKKFAERFKAPFYDLDGLKKEHNLSRKLLMLIVEQVAKTERTIVFEGGIDTEAQRTEIRNILRAAGYEPVLVWIQTDVNTIKSRLKMRARSTSAAKAEYEERIEKLEAPTDLETPIVLSGKHTFETQLKHILSRLA